jgi:hypothetical protein
MTVNEIAEWFLKEGTLYDFYDPLGMISPRKFACKKSIGAIQGGRLNPALYMRILWGLTIQ